MNLSLLNNFCSSDIVPTGPKRKRRTVLYTILATRYGPQSVAISDWNSSTTSVDQRFIKKGQMSQGFRAEVYSPEISSIHSDEIRSIEKRKKKQERKERNIVKRSIVYERDAYTFLSREIR